MKHHNNTILRRIMATSLLLISAIMISSMVSSCEINEEFPSGGSGSSTNSSKFVGTWSRQVQWASTNGTREETYTLRSGGSGTYKSWDWLDQKYYTTSLTWSAYGDYITISRKDTQDTHFPDVSGYINSSGSALKINDYWYNKQ